MNDKLKPAIIGGVVLGLLSVIPFVYFANVCCCLWAIIGGMLATFLYVKNSPTPANAGDGAMLGALAGVVGAVISVVLGIPIDYVMGPIMRNMIVGLVERLDPRQADMLRQQVEAAGTSIGPIIFNALILAVLLVVFSTIGGLLGVPIFERRKGGAPPPPPSQNDVG
jgi:CDP-diglyceride synthetase